MKDKKLPDPIKDPAKALLKIVHGDVEDLHIPHKSIVSGKKMRNDLMRQFVETFRAANTIDDKTLTEVILTLDEAIEKEILTEEVLEEMRKNPDTLKKLLLQESE